MRGPNGSNKGLACCIDLNRGGMLTGKKTRPVGVNGTGQRQVGKSLADESTNGPERGSLVARKWKSRGEQWPIKGDSRDPRRNAIYVQKPGNIPRTQPIKNNQTRKIKNEAPRVQVKREISETPQVKSVTQVARRKSIKRPQEERLNQAQLEIKSVQGRHGALPSRPSEDLLSYLGK